MLTDKFNISLIAFYSYKIISIVNEKEKNTKSTPSDVTIKDEPQSIHITNTFRVPSNKTKHNEIRNAGNF
jgi:hypothetical protein